MEKDEALIRAKIDLQNCRELAARISSLVDGEEKETAISDFEYHFAHLRSLSATAQKRLEEIDQNNPVSDQELKLFNNILERAKESAAKRRLESSRASAEMKKTLGERAVESASKIYIPRCHELLAEIAALESGSPERNDLVLTLDAIYRNLRQAVRDAHLTRIEDLGGEKPITEALAKEIESLTKNSAEIRRRTGEPKSMIFEAGKRCY